MATPIIAKVEVAWGANLANAPGTWTWTDITADVRADGLQFTTGRGDEASQAQPTQATFAVNDPLGKYVPRNALGLNYPYVRQNTPFRLTLASGVRTIIYADSYAPSWDESTQLPVVTISASGVLRRLGQGRSNSRSAMRRRIEALAPVAYWSLEDGDSNTAGGGSALSGGTAIAAIGGWQFGNNSAPVGSATSSAKRTSDTSTLYGRLPSPATSSIRIDLAMYKDPSDTSDSQLTIHAVTGTSWAFGLSSSVSAGAWHHHRIEVYNNAGTPTLDWYVDGVQTTSGTALVGTWQNIHAVSVEVAGGASNRDAFNHLAVFSPRISSDSYQAFLGYPLEDAATRIARLCADANIQATVTGLSITAMAPEGVGTLTDKLRACEAADGGILTDGGSNGGLTYLARSARYNQAAALTLDNNQLQLARPFNPIEDDQRRRNDWTVTRASSAGTGEIGRWVDATGPQGTAAVGLYDDSVSLELGSDIMLTSQASWRVHLGTVEQMRYPTVVLNLRAHPELVTAWLNAFVGARLTLKNLPSQHQAGDVDLIIEGWTEFSDGFSWVVSMNTSPYDPWRVMRVADASVGRLDTAGSTLAAGASAGATSLSVATTTGPLWTTSGADLPLTALISGIPVTVTNITGSSSPQTFTVTGSTVTKALANGSAVSLNKPGVIAL